MPTNRSTVLASGEVYHLFNRGVERRPTFTQKREYQRAAELIDYYHFADTPIRYSQVLLLPADNQRALWEKLRSDYKRELEILAYCLMPNHFHLVVRQMVNGGTSRFAANFTNSYTKYFNTKHEREGPLFQGAFKAVRVETEEQLLHVTRYIHLNPVTSFLIPLEELVAYPWSSYREYLGEKGRNLCKTTWMHSHFRTVQAYKTFVEDQADYARRLENIKHLAIDVE